MRALALVTARELRAFAPAWIAVFVAALLPWLAPLLPTAGTQPAPEVRMVTALVLASLLGLLIAVFAGAGVLARDLGEGRVGFFLALPLRARTIWAGRLLAAAILVYTTLAAITLPAVLAAGELPLRRGLLTDLVAPSFLGPLRAWSVALLLLAPLVLILLSHQLATGLRSRSPWLLVDLVALAVAGLLVGGAALRLVTAGAPIELLIAGGAFGTLALLTLALGGGFGLARGGVLLARVHRAQACAVAAGLLVAALAAVVFTRWALAVDAADLRRVAAVIPAPAGPWIAVGGELRLRPSYAPWLLVDPTTGRSLPLSAGFHHPAAIGYEAASTVVFAADGRSAAWMRPRGGRFAGPRELMWLDLQPGPRLVPTGIAVASGWQTALLPEGGRLAVAEPTRLAAWSDDGRRLLAAAKLPPTQPSWPQLRWVTPDRLRLARIANSTDEAPRLQVWDLEVGARRLDARLDRPLATTLTAMALSSDGARLLLVHGMTGRGGVTLVDAASGEPVAELATPARAAWVSAGFLSGGRVALITGQSGRLTLRLFARDGVLVGELPLGAGRWAWLGAPWSRHEVPFTASVRRREAGAEPSWHGELRVADLATGRVRVLGGRLAPVAGAHPWSPGSDRIAPGAPGTRLFLAHDRALVRVDDRGRQDRLLPKPR
jgi:hypothetical protein